ncbi:MAG TPA: SlyX family protein [Myxococcota bacterium]|nr:SlyX family protein [Myxococcota bacterium]
MVTDEERQAYEVKIAFLERDLRDLDDVVRALVVRLDRVEAELAGLREQDVAASVRGSLAEEVPPHSVRW